MSFETQLAFQWARCLRDATPLLLIMADLDEFKEINDRCGHVAGDGVLRAVGTALKESLRAHDLVARFGGDEFIILCSHCPPRFAGNLVVRMRDAVHRIDPPPALPHRRFHLSLGLAGVASDFRHVSTAQLIAEADRCLLRAKAAGKDQAFLCVLDEPEASEPRVLM
jgi:diguanylate cyclase (GGDEF)-like protein